MRCLSNGQLAIEKSAFRKNLARKYGLAPGEATVKFIMMNFEVLLLPLEEMTPDGIVETEKSLIKAIRPPLNRAGKGSSELRPAMDVPDC